MSGENEKEKKNEVLQSVLRNILFKMVLNLNVMMQRNGIKYLNNRDCHRFGFCAMYLMAIELSNNN